MKKLLLKLSKSIKCSFLVLVLYLGSLAGVNAQDSKGTDFWLMFNTNISSPVLTIFIASDVATSGIVAIPGLGFSAPFVVAANSVTPVVVPASAATHTNNTVGNKGIHVTSLQEVTVYGLNYAPFTTDAYLGLPTDVLGTDHIIMTYSGQNLSELGVVGTVAGTIVTITPSVTANGRPAGVPFNITLNQGETFQLGNATDLTGSIVTSTQPVGVMGANGCANIPVGYAYCDHINEMIPPTTTWGKKFATVPLKTRINGDTWRFMASENATVVSINGVPQPAINRGQFLERILTTQSIVESTKPILAAQFANGSTFSGNPGDPFMMLIPSLEQFLAKYTVTTVSGYVAHHINIVAPAAIVGTLTLDGVVVPAASFTPIGASGFSGAQITVTPGNHNLLGTLPFGVFMYGFNTDDSYGYPGGQAFGAVATVTTLVLTPETGSAQVGTNQCFNALVKDQFDNPVPGVRVDFTITGANPGSTGFAFTNASGVAQFCYTGANAGVDNIVASVGTLTDASTFTWNDLGCVVNCPSNITVNSDSHSCGKTVHYPPATTTGLDCGEGPLTYSKASGSWFDLGTTVITVTAPSGATCTFTVTVVDATNPTIPIRPQDIYINAATNTCSRVVNFSFSAADNCPGVTAVAVPPSGSTFNVGTTPVVITATDGSGNTSSYTFNVTVDDRQRPTITCSPNVIVGTDPGICKALVTLIPPVATDNCPGVTVSAFRHDFKALNDYYLPGTTTITWTATDASGNIRECIQKVTVKDLEAPVITNASTNLQELWPPDHTMRLIEVNYDLSDNCNGTSSTLSVTSNEAISGTGPGDLSPDWQILDRYTVRLRAERADNGTGRIYTIKITGKDAAGNTSIQNLYVYVPLNNNTLISEALSNEISAPKTLIPEKINAPKELTSSLKAQLVPNPTQSIFSLVIKGSTNEAVEISVFDVVTGREIQRISGAANDVVRFGNNLMKGTYIIEVRQGKNKVVLRGVKQ